MVLNIQRRRDIRRCRTARVWLDGVEVTRLCRYVDGRRGIIHLFRLNSDGKKYRDEDTKMAATVVVRGHVQWGCSR